jgi:chorismate mutase/prephenate dehydratase
VLADDIQSEPRNRTRFLVIAPPGAEVPPLVGTETAPRGSTLLLSVHNVPGALYRVLGVLADHELNMRKLESRPSRTQAWDYVFWIELDADLCAPEAAPAVERLRATAVELRIMGCYPRATEPV